MGTWAWAFCSTGYPSRSFTWCRSNGTPTGGAGHAVVRVGIGGRCSPGGTGCARDAAGSPGTAGGARRHSTLETGHGLSGRPPKPESAGARPVRSGGSSCAAVQRLARSEPAAPTPSSGWRRSSSAVAASAPPTPARTTRSPRSRSRSRCSLVPGGLPRPGPLDLAHHVAADQAAQRVRLAGQFGRAQRAEVEVPPPQACPRAGASRAGQPAAPAPAPRPFPWCITCPFRR